MKTSILSSLLVLAAAGSINPSAAAPASVAASGPAAAVHEHREFDATLHAPWRGDAGDARTFTLAFDYPGLPRTGSVAWRLDLVGPDGRVVQRWRGRQPLTGRPTDVTVRWPGSVNGRRPASGIWRVRLHAQAAVAAGAAPETVDQSWQIAEGTPPAPQLPAFSPLPTARAVADTKAAPAAGALPYTVHYGNLHSQTSHSDGGAALDACKGAQDPQTGTYGPDAAYAYAREHGLDILMASEHNHMYDGSDGTAPDADPAAATALYRAGLAQAQAANAAHPAFLALYGMEWGVINNGGHLNIFNSDELLGWEKNAAGALLADTATARGDYGALYALMRRRGWIGQFNHPAPDGQFAVGGKALAYTEDGDAAMALCEVLNTSAFSTSTDEGETRRSSYEPACNRLLEAGYHLAFASNQDNHCANWGASYSNRTAVLIANGVPLSRDSFVEALRARRVFATMDKDSQLIFTANDRLMGERFDNSGALRLRVQWAGAAGRSAASVAIMEGVPGRNGTVTQLSADARLDFTPAPGAHFYYAKVTQDDGKVLWSAPVWVDQR